MENKDYNEQLVLDNLKLIHYVIKKINYQFKNEDEYQEYYDYGLLGLINGVKTYNKNKGKISTYLYTCILNEIRKQIRLNLTNKRKINKICKISLNKAVLPEEDMELIDFIPDESINIEKQFQEKFIYEAILHRLNKFDYVNRVCVKMFYGIDGYQKKTCTEIGKILGFTKEAANQHVCRTINRIIKDKDNLQKEYVRYLYGNNGSFNNR